MSATSAAVMQRTGVEAPRPAETPFYQSVMARLSPRQGWTTFFVWVAAAGLVVWNVREAGWVETPGLLAIVAVSSVTGLLLAQARLPWPVLHLAGLSIGSLMVVWQASSLVVGRSLPERVRELWVRLDAWYEAATTGGISTDLLPVALALLTAAWLLGYAGAWSLFRAGNVWTGLLLSGTALLTNLSFLPADFDSRFFLFILLALLLVALVSMAQRHDRWRKAGLRFNPNGSWLAMSATTALVAVALVLAASLPMKVYVSRTAVDIWNWGRSPIAGVEDELARLFSGIAARKDVQGRFFGRTLPFQGKISFGGEVVMWASSLRPTYWLSRTYGEYTSKGWIAGESSSQKVIDRSEPPPPQEPLGRESAEQSVELAFDSERLFYSGNVSWVSRDAVVETLEPLRFEIDLKSSAGDTELPEDVRALAEDLRRFNPSNTSDDLSQITMAMPDDLVLVSPSPDASDGDGSPLVRLTLARKAPELPDVVAWRFEGRINANETYALRSYVSTATNEDLGSAGSEYSGFIRDHYLQLPSSLPQPVRDLAEDLTEESQTQLDKALAIQDYLRGPTFEYSRDIDRPPRDADGTDHFLFKLKKGYSDYFASAMAVMLRAVGVPTRLAAGYAPGVAEDGGSRRAVRDSDSHGWTQVYFPGYGWIDFEPTPNWADPRRDVPGEAGSRNALESELRENCFELFDFDFGEMVAIVCVEEEPESSLESTQLLPEGLQVQSFELDPFAQETTAGEANRAFSRLLAIALGAFAALGLIAWLAWARGMGGATLSERIYAKMGRLGTIAGLGRRAHQTPFEYATVLGNAVPSIAAGARTAAIAFASTRYGRRDPGEPLQETLEDELEYQEELDQAWKSVRSGLLLRGLRRLVRLGGA